MVLITIGGVFSNLTCLVTESYRAKIFLLPEAILLFLSQISGRLVGLCLGYQLKKESLP